MIKYLDYLRFTDSVGKLKNVTKVVKFIFKFG
jgi:hypothetical protein